MLHRTGKNRLLNLHFLLQAAWLRQRDSAVSSCHLLFLLLALPQWHLAAPASPTLQKRAQSLRVCWLRSSREHPCVHSSHRAGFLVSFTVLWAQAAVCLQARGAKRKRECMRMCSPARSSLSPSKCRHPLSALKLQPHSLSCSLSQVTIHI